MESLPKKRGARRGASQVEYFCRKGRKRRTRNTCLRIFMLPAASVPDLLLKEAEVVMFRSRYVCTSGKIKSRVAFISSDFLSLDINVGNSIEIIWPCASLSVFECISFTNTNFGKNEIAGQTSQYWLFACFLQVSFILRDVNSFWKLTRESERPLFIWEKFHSVKNNSCL